jgi:hypothetical protein
MNAGKHRIQPLYNLNQFVFGCGKGRPDLNNVAEAIS